MALYTIVATLTGASHNAEVMINGHDIPMRAAGGDEWRGANVLELPDTPVPLVAAPTGVAQAWGVAIDFTPKRASSPYKKDKIATSPLQDMV